MPGSRNTQKASSQRCSGDSNNGKVQLSRVGNSTNEIAIRFQEQPEAVILSEEQPAAVILSEEQPAGQSISSIEEFFRYSPVPVQQFGVDNTWKNSMENGMEPPPYIPITRNMYLVEKKRSEWDDDSGCEKCSSICSEDCLCRYQNMSCSKACRCSNTCTNRPFQKHKRIEVVKTKSCGWGAEAAEPINKGEFIVEYVGEVLSDDIYEERLRDMDCLGRQHFYMCKVDRDFTIDSTYKGNISRFLNHSCDPNCTLEKWQVNGETRMGIFAAKSIEEGEPLTYDYRFVQSGADVKCECGSSNCQGFLGVKKKARGGRKAR
nr:PREDICTED: histone-lysine N-methyltransferase ASHR3-like [Daucus carota subsp. sativus]